MHQLTDPIKVLCLVLGLNGPFVRNFCPFPTQPEKVQELEGITVSAVSCGGHHSGKNAFYTSGHSDLVTRYFTILSASMLPMLLQPLLLLLYLVPSLTCPIMSYSFSLYNFDGCPLHMGWGRLREAGAQREVLRAETNKGGRTTGRKGESELHLVSRAREQSRRCISLAFHQALYTERQNSRIV